MPFVQPLGTVEKEKTWDIVGVHRPLAGYWYNFVLDILALVLGLLLVGVFLPLILPWSEILGFQTLTANLFALTFTLFDLGIGTAVERFVAEKAGSNPRETVKYVQFFLWFQMFTGLIQVTGIAIFVFTWLPATNLNYAAWFFLCYSTIQYPGMLSVYHKAISAFQHYGKASIISFVQGSVLQITTQLLCVLLGRYIGAMTPQLGELMGATIGYIVGAYVDDFIAFAIAAKIFANILKPYGIRFRDTIGRDFTREDAKKCIKFGVNIMGASIAGNVLATVSTLLSVAFVPSYAYWLGAISVADTITRLVTKCEMPTLTAPIAEAYLNGKLKLAQFYLAHQWKLYGMMSAFLSVQIVTLASPIIHVVGKEYALAGQIIPLLMISRIGVSTIHFSDGLMAGADRPQAILFALLLQRSVGIVSQVLFLGVFRMGWIGIPLAQIPEFYSKVIFAWWYINRKILPVKVPWWQTFGASWIAGGALAVFNYLTLHPLFQQLQLLMDPMLAGGLVVLIGVLGCSVGFYFPLYALLGGWDDNTLRDFRDAVRLSGPSKWLAVPIYRSSHFFARLSRLTNRFPLSVPGAAEEASALQLMRSKKT